MAESSIWFSAIGAYSEYIKVRDLVGVEAVESDGQYQKVMETRAVAVLCFALYEASHTVWYMQLRKSEITDALIMRESPEQPGTNEMLGVEVTSYIRNKTGLPKDSLLDQLKKTKMFEKYHKYTDHDVVLVDLGWHYEANFLEIKQYMAEIKAPYELWFLQEIKSKPDTILQMTLCNKKIAFERKINIGKAWHAMQEQGVYYNIQTQRVGSIEKVGHKQEGERIQGAPWETMLLS